MKAILTICFDKDEAGKPLDVTILKSPNTSVGEVLQVIIGMVFQQPKVVGPADAEVMAGKPVKIESGIEKKEA